MSTTRLTIAGAMTTALIAIADEAWRPDGSRIDIRLQGVIVEGELPLNPPRGQLADSVDPGGHPVHARRPCP